MKNLATAVLIISLVFGLTGNAYAATTVSLGTADSFAVLAGTEITNVPTSVITGDTGLSPAAGTNYAGLTTLEVSGTIYAVDATGPDGIAGNNPGLLTTAKNDLVTAYDNAAGQSATSTFVGADNQLGGQTLTPGVYAFGGASTANLIGTLTLDGQGDANAVFIFPGLFHPRYRFEQYCRSHQRHSSL
ncbi:MAG: ice-binding family protein [Patescibacteria group bacterium]